MARESTNRIRAHLREPVQIESVQRPAGARVRRPRQRPLKLQLTTEPSASPIIDYRQVAELTKRGVEDNAARKLVAELPAGYDMLSTLEWGDQQVNAQPKLRYGIARYWDWLRFTNGPYSPIFIALITVSRGKMRAEVGKQITVRLTKQVH